MPAAPDVSQFNQLLIFVGGLVATALIYWAGSRKPAPVPAIQGDEAIRRDFESDLESIRRDFEASIASMKDSFNGRFTQAESIHASSLKALADRYDANARDAEDLARETRKQDNMLGRHDERIKNLEKHVFERGDNPHRRGHSGS